MLKKFKNYDPQQLVEQSQDSAVVLTNKAKLSLYKKSISSGIQLDILEEVYRRGYSIWNDSFGESPEKFAFDRINSFIAGGFAHKLDNDLLEAVKNKNNPESREVGTDSATEIYKNDTPGQEVKMKSTTDIIKEIMSEMIGTGSDISTTREFLTRKFSSKSAARKKDSTEAGRGSADIMKNVATKEETDPNRNTEVREKEPNVGRPDTAKSPVDPKSKLAKQGQIKTKIIDEGTSTMFSKNFGLPLELINAVRDIVEKKDEANDKDKAANKDSKKNPFDKTSKSSKEDDEDDDDNKKSSKSDDDDDDPKDDDGTKKLTKTGKSKVDTEPKLNSKIVDEETDVLVELAKKTLDRYARHNSGEAFKKYISTGAPLKDEKKKTPGQIKLAKEEIEEVEEEVEVLDELSKKTLRSYADKAFDDYAKTGLKMRTSHKKLTDADKSQRVADRKNEDKRTKGIDVAQSKLQPRVIRSAKVPGTGKDPLYSEEVEVLDELSKKTLRSYHNKAFHDYNKTGWRNKVSAAVQKHEDKRSAGMDLAQSKLAIPRAYNKVSAKVIGTGKDPLHSEEVNFSNEEIAFFATILGEDDIGQKKKPDLAKNGDKIVDGVSSVNLTDSKKLKEESELEEAQRGRPRKNAEDGSGTERASSPNLAAQVKMHSKADASGHHTLVHPDTGKSHKVPAEHVRKFYNEYMSAEKPDHKEKIEKKFKDSLT